MFEVTIYMNNGGRKMYDHVAQVTNLTNDNIVLDFVTDFDDHISKVIKAEEVYSISMRCMK